MKNKLIVLLFIIIVLLGFNFSFAKNQPNDPIINKNYSNCSVIDTNKTKYLHFSFADNLKPIYCSEKAFKLHNNRYSVDISKLQGTQNIIFIDSDQNETSFTYYFSNNIGQVNDYKLVDGKDLNVFVTTYKNIQILYTDKEEKTIESLKKYIDEMPPKLLMNLKQIKMIPYSNTSNIAGSTKENRITLYNFTKYDEKTQKNIIFHETTHTYANMLIEQGELDENYSDYRQIVNKDRNYVSNYSKVFANANNGILSEDFADAIAFYLIDKDLFKTKYPNRTKFIESLIK